MNFLIAGCGSIGQRHMRNLIALGQGVIGFEPDPRKRASIEKEYGVTCYDDLDEALDQELDAVFVCSPTSTHIPIALKAAEEGKHLFIEKPLSNSLEDVDKLGRIIEKKHLVCFNACNTRFFPSLKLAKRLIDEGRIGRVLSARVECGFYLPYWHPYEDYRMGYSAKKSLGGGVILDDIHELDSMLWLFGKVKEVFCVSEKLSDLEIDTEDVAEIFLRFESGVIAQIHLDYLQRTYRRSYQFIGDAGVIIWDYIDQTVKLYTNETNHYELFQENINTSREKMFIDEVKHFINCIEGVEKPNDMSDAVSTLKVALACQESSRSKKVVNPWGLI